MIVDLLFWKPPEVKRTVNFSDESYLLVPILRDNKGIYRNKNCAQWRVHNAVVSARPVALWLCYHRGISTVLLQPLNVQLSGYPKRTHPSRVIAEDTNVKLVHISACKRLYACLRIKLVRVAANVQQHPLGGVTEFSLTPARSPRLTAI